MHKNIVVKSPEADALKKTLESKTDPESLRLKRFLSMPDLSRLPGSPIHEVVENILRQPDFKDFDVVEVPEIVSVKVGFDLFDFPLDHPSRSQSDTYYVDDEHILRTHTTVMWYYYLRDEGVKARMAA